MPGVVTAKQGRLFDRAGADQTLPYLRPLVADIVRDYNMLKTLQEEKRQTQRRNRPTVELVSRIDVLKLRLERHLEDLAEVGAEMRCLERGVVDFPAIIEGQPAFYSWMLDEPSVRYWHPADQGFEARSRL